MDRGCLACCHWPVCKRLGLKLCYIRKSGDTDPDSEPIQGRDSDLGLPTTPIDTILRKAREQWEKEQDNAETEE